MPFGTLGEGVKHTVTVGNQTPEVGNLKFGSSLPGGYDTCTGTISETARVAGGANYFAGKPVKVQIAAGEPGAGTVVFEGFVNRRVKPSQSNACELSCVGAVSIPKRTRQTRLYRSDSYAPWGNRSDDDFNINPNHQGIGAKVDGRILYEIGARGSYGNGNSAGVAAVFPEAQITKVTAVNGKSTNHPDWSIRCRSFTAPLAGGDEALMTQIGALRTLSSSGIAQGATWTFDFPLAAQKNACNLDIVHQGTNGISEANTFTTGINTVRVYGIATTDNYFASDVVDDLCANVFDFDSTLVQNTTTPILPIYWQRSNSMDNLLDEIAVVDQFEWRVRERAGSGKFKMEFFPWTSAVSVNHYIAYNDPNLGEVDIRDTDDVVNKVKVYFDTASGRRKHVTVNATGAGGLPTDYYAGTEWAYTKQAVVMDYDLDNRYASDVYPTAVATALLKQYGVQIPEGTVSLATVRQGSATGTEIAACRILAGDRLNIVGGPQAGQYRIYEARHEGEGLTTLTIGRRPGTFQALMAKHLKRIERKGR